MNEVLYHYTDAGGLIGIISGRKIYCSNIVYLNDANEWEHGLDLLLEMLTEIAEDKGPTTAAGLLDVAGAKHVLHELQRILRTIKRGPSRPNSSNQIPPCFAASLSQGNPELDLAQWRSYSKPGSRYAIGFNRARLEEIARDNKMTLDVVEYGHSTAKNMIRDQLAAALGAMCVGPSPNVRSVMDVYGLCMSICVQYGTTCKHEGFTAEQEVRLRLNANPPKDKFCFRPGNDFVVPYFELDIAPLERVIDSVCVGPTSQPLLAQRSVEQLLFQKGGIANPKVHVTKIPFRG